jgi:hypothetical protein
MLPCARYYILLSNFWLHSRRPVQLHYVIFSTLGLPNSRLICIQDDFYCRESRANPQIDPRKQHLEWSKRPTVSCMSLVSHDARHCPILTMCSLFRFNTLAIAWSMPAELFSIGGRYEWVTISYIIGFFVPIPFWLAYRYTHLRIFKYLNASMILWYMGWLFVGINASITMYFAIGFFSQWFLRRRYPQLFVKYNYIVSAALDGGTQVLVFILTFAVFGGSGVSRPFPTWAGNPDTEVHNLDYCMVNPGSA